MKWMLFLIFMGGLSLPFADSAEIPLNLQEQILYGSPRTRMHGIESLSSKGKLTRSAEEFLMQVAVQDKSFYVKKSALHTLQTAGHDTFQLQTILLDFISDFSLSYDFRKFCVEILVQMRAIDSSLQPRLFRLLLKEGHYYFREEAVKILHHVRVFDHELQKILLNIVEQEGKNKAVVYLKQEVIQLLKKITDFEIQKRIILLALKSKSIYIRSALMQTLSNDRHNFSAIYRSEWFYKNLIQAVASEVQATLAIDMLKELNHVPDLDYEAQEQLVDLLKNPFTFYNLQNQLIKMVDRVTDPYLHWQFVQAGVLLPSRHLVHNLFEALSASVPGTLTPHHHQSAKRVAASLIKVAVLLDTDSPPLFSPDIHARALGLLGKVVKSGRLSLTVPVQEALVKILQNKHIAHVVLKKVMGFFSIITDLKLKQDMVLFIFDYGRPYINNEVIHFVNLLPSTSPVYENREFQKNLIAAAFFETNSDLQQRLFSLIGKITHPTREVRVTLKKAAAQHPNPNHRQLARHILYDLIQGGTGGPVQPCHKVL